MERPWGKPGLLLTKTRRIKKSSPSAKNGQMTPLEAGSANWLRWMGWATVLVIELHSNPVLPRGQKWAGLDSNQ